MEKRGLLHTDCGSGGDGDTNKLAVAAMAVTGTVAAMVKLMAAITHIINTTPSIANLAVSISGDSDGGDGEGGGSGGGEGEGGHIRGCGGIGGGRLDCGNDDCSSNGSCGGIFGG